MDLSVGAVFLLSVTLHKNDVVNLCKNISIKFQKSIDKTLKKWYNIIVRGGGKPQENGMNKPKGGR
jgi:hypothetical protein